MDALGLVFTIVTVVVTSTCSPPIPVRREVTFPVAVISIPSFACVPPMAITAG